MKSLAAALAGAVLVLTAGTAFSLPINDRGGDITFSSGSLQSTLDNFTSPDRINAITDQSSVANWTLGDLNASRAWLVSPAAATTANSRFGIYSVKTGAEYDLLYNGLAKSNWFEIDSSGTLDIAGDVDPTFGTAFGFYFQKQGFNTVYTEDDMNGTKVHSLVYTVTGSTDLGNAVGGDDWIMAFRSSESGDFTEGVYLVKDLNPVPEPGTMMLFGAGFLGLAIYSKRRKNA